jgi:biofilm PGA synthesis N-glycosyltransferase PgaC
MVIAITISSIIFFLSLFGILTIFLFNPLLLMIVSLSRRAVEIKSATKNLSVSMLIIVRNAENIITEKIENSLNLRYPSENIKIIIVSDGSTDETENIIKSFICNNLQLVSLKQHKGKNMAIDQGIKSCIGEIVIFSDVDAMLDGDAILYLTKYFSDPSVGGVCGQRVIAENDKKLKKAQSDYIRFDSIIKKLESKTGSISSNDGKLYAVRKDLFRPIPPAVTDDLFTCLSIIKQGYRFLFEPNAKAFIKVPSRNPKHELTRRRRIVCRSLTGIFLQKELLNPFKYGIFSIRLFINKILRRFLPICMILMFLSSIFLSFHIPFIRILVFLQFIFYILAFSYLIVFQNVRGFKFMKRITSLAYYFCLGNYGTLLGLIDFIRGKKVVKWEPFKAD